MTTVSGRPDAEILGGTLTGGAPTDGQVIRANTDGIIGFELRGTWSGVVAVQRRPFGGTWVAAQDPGGTAITFAANGARDVTAKKGFEYRVNFTTPTSGTPTYDAIFSPL